MPSLLITSTLQYIIESNVVHNNFYSYSLTKFKSMKESVIVTCPIHGHFKIHARNHCRRRKGCQKCSKEKQIQTYKKVFKDTFLNKARKIHGIKYIYPVIPDNNREIIPIICPKHGEFKQYVLSHLQGYPCKRCSIEKRKKTIGYTYGGWKLDTWYQSSLISPYFESYKLYKVILYNDSEKFYKIGRTYTSLKRRMSTIPYNYKIIEVIEGSASYIFNKELELKRALKPNKYTPLIKFRGKTECYKSLIINNK